MRTNFAIRTRERWLTVLVPAPIVVHDNTPAPVSAYPQQPTVVHHYHDGTGPGAGVFIFILIMLVIVGAVLYYFWKKNGGK